MKYLTSILVLILLVPFSIPNEFYVPYRDLSLTFVEKNNFGITPPINLFQQQELVPIGEQTALQGFYWLVPDNGEWWHVLKEKSTEFTNVGFDAIWTPPPIKTDSGTFATGGYEPYDFYDLGEFDQKGRIRTRYGTRSQLEEFISTANSLGLGVIADIVINHRQGGEPEFNPYTNSVTNTNFENIASGKLKMNYTHFWPNQYGDSDRYQFANFPDISHDHPYVHDELIKWGTWLRDEIGFDGWRFDVAHGINETMQKDWMDQVGGFGVGEYWFGEFGDILDYLENTDETLRAFDFYLMYALRWMAISEGSYDLRNLRREGLIWNDQAPNSMTFAVNHDTVRDENVNIENNLDLVYSYILTHEGYPTIFWQNYFDPDLQPTLRVLLSVRKNLAKGSTSVLYSDSDLYVMQREGNPGILYLLNDNPFLKKSREISTKWQNQELSEYLMNGPNLMTDNDGKITVSVPPDSFLIYTPENPFGNVSKVFDYMNPVTALSVDKTSVEINGKFDLSWGTPIIFDNRADAANLQTDLYNGYLLFDNKFLYFGFSNGKKLIDETIEFGIAIDTKEGGAFDIPGTNTNIRFQPGNNPDYLITLITDDEDPWNKLSQASFYTYNEKWLTEEILQNTEFASDVILGFTEIRIPLDKIEFKSNNRISVKIYSSTSDITTASDTMPQDTSLVSGDGNSWLSMPEGIPINLETVNQGTDNGFLSFQIIQFLIFNLLLPVLLKFKKTDDQLN